MSNGDDTMPDCVIRWRAHDDCPGVDAVIVELMERLRVRRGDLAVALAGRALSVQIEIDAVVGGPYRMGFGAEGYVTSLSPSNPLTLGFSPDAVISGTAHEILVALAAREPAPDSVRLLDLEAWPRYARVHRIVGTELRAWM